MAFSKVNASDIEYMAKAFKEAAANLALVATSLKKSSADVTNGTLVVYDDDYDVTSVFLQVSSARGYADKIKKFGGDAVRHFENQLHCAVSGELPEWKNSRRKSEYNRALKKSKLIHEQLGLIEPEAGRNAKQKNVPKKKKA